MAEITFDDYIKVDIRVGEILSADNVPKSEKLLQLKVNFGSEIGTRIILAGIAKSFSVTTDLIGRKILFVINLAPRKMMGIESHGMVFAAEKADGSIALAMCPDVEPGTKVG